MLFEHTQRFMREVMAERLREEGFVSYKGEDIHWYRLVNNDICRLYILLPVIQRFKVTLLISATEFTHCLLHPFSKRVPICMQCPE